MVFKVCAVFITGFPWKAQQVAKLSKSQNVNLKIREDGCMAMLSTCVNSLQSAQNLSKCLQIGIGGKHR